MAALLSSSTTLTAARCSTRALHPEEVLRDERARVEDRLCSCTRKLAAACSTHGRPGVGDLDDAAHPVRGHLELRAQPKRASSAT